jgi:hypothetical protein
MKFEQAYYNPDQIKYLFNTIYKELYVKENFHRIPIGRKPGKHHS